MPTNVYCRGKVFWWRRTLRFSALTPHPTTVRLSLRTRCPREAKAWAASLEASMEEVAASAAKELKPRLSAQDVRTVFQVAFQHKLDQIIVQQVSTPMRAEAHRAANKVYARWFTVLTECLSPPEPDDELAEKLQVRGVSEKDRDALFATMQLHRGKSPISPGYIAEHLRNAGIKPNLANMKAIGRVIAAAYRQACIAACEALTLPLGPDEVDALPAVLAEFLGLLRNPAPQQSGKTASTPLQVHQLPPAAKHETATSTTDRNGDQDVSLSELAGVTAAHKIAAGEWRKETGRDLDATVQLFIAANGDLLCSQVSQRHVSALTALFPRLPSRYGHTAEDIQGGIVGALARGDRLREQWVADPVSCELQKVQRVGLSAVTHNKHLTMLNALVTFAEGHGYVVPAMVPGKARAKVKKMKGLRRPTWIAEELRELFRAPIWTGCAGLWRRLEPGVEVFHDAAYWVPLLLATTAARSEEANGLELADIYDEARVPFIWIRANAHRLLKNGQSDRKLPIASTLKELGFLDYVKEMRSLGHVLAFPEMAGKSGFDHEFYDKIFAPLRGSVFPNGTGALKGRKDADVHSMRSRALSELRDRGFDPALRHYLAGHVPIGETAASYEEEPDLDVLLPLVEALAAALVLSIVARQLLLRPAEWQKPGAPRGRRRTGRPE